MKLTISRNTLLTAVLCLAPSALMAAAGGIPGPTPHPNAPPSPADLQVVWAGDNVALGYQSTLQVVLTVSDSETGLPVSNLSKGNFTATFASVYPLCSAPIIKSVFNPTPGIYQLVMGFADNTLCTWKPARFPVAFQVFSTFNPANPLSPGSYQGQVSTLLEVH
jgi:hypothetical protein